MNLRMTVIEINIEGGEMASWIDDLAAKAKEQNSDELTKGEIRLQNAKIIQARFPAFWDALLKQVDSDCLELKKKLPDNWDYHFRKEPAPYGFTLTCEAAPP